MSIVAIWCYGWG